ncbi:MAG: glutathione S-transferase N-terminal domain-containing protein, partial [Rhodospirillales bacterium]|nr:glutathione S-transferase N-terminal domain-containing protein [Rhodospirillales bacterium]
GAGECRFSPYCWRTRLALAHKGLTAELIPVRFSDKDLIAFSGQSKVPVLVDGDTTLSDSWTIAGYLEDTYADRPSLFGGAGGRGATRILNAWMDKVQNPLILRMIVLDVFNGIEEADRDYFRASREQRFAMPLEDVPADRAARIEDFRAGLDFLRDIVAGQPFLSGATAAYADYIVFSGFQWARSISRFELLKADDPLNPWRDRMLGLFDGLAAKAAIPSG